MLKPKDIVLAKVTGIFKYGFFIKIGDYKGLCHISEISNGYVDDIEKFVKVNDEIYVLILDVDYETNRVKVSIKDINYLKNCENEKLIETRKGFLPLKEMLPVWVNKKMNDYKNEEKNRN